MKPKQIAKYYYRIIDQNGLLNTLSSKFVNDSGNFMNHEVIKIFTDLELQEPFGMIHYNCRDIKKNSNTSYIDQSMKIIDAELNIVYRGDVFTEEVRNDPNANTIVTIPRIIFEGHDRKDRRIKTIIDYDNFGTAKWNKNGIRYLRRIRVVRRK